MAAIVTPADYGTAVGLAVVAGVASSARTDLPLALCNVAVLVAAAACWWQVPVLVELTWVRGMAGTLQAVVTPDLSSGYPHLQFFRYLVGPLGIVLAASFLVVGMGIAPRRGAVPRALAITAAYTAAAAVAAAAARRARPPRPAH